MKNLATIQQIEIADDVVFRQVGEEIVFLNLETGFYYGLDAIGFRMWELLMEKKSLDPVIETLKQEYEVAPEILRRDLLHLLEELHTKGLLKISSS